MPSGTYQVRISDAAIEVVVKPGKGLIGRMYPEWHLSRSDVERLPASSQQPFIGGKILPCVEITYGRPEDSRHLSIAFLNDDAAMLSSPHEPAPQAWRME